VAYLLPFKGHQRQQGVSPRNGTGRARIGGVGTMRQTLWKAATGLALALLAGCSTGPLLENPFPISAPAPEGEPNPVFVPQGPISYRKIYDHALFVLKDFGFEILEQSVYEGRIETLPRVAPGLFQYLKPGNPDPYERFLATLQSYRHRASILIQPSQMGGYFIHVTVYKELEDLPRPVRATAGGAIFRTDNDIERQYTVVDPTIFEANWIPKGRDLEVEQVLLERLKRGFCP
jgi:hypothetical protein